MVHISCITCPRDLPDMYTHALGPNGPQAWVYISGKSLGYMIQLLHKWWWLPLCPGVGPSNQHVNHNYIMLTTILCINYIEKLTICIILFHVITERIVLYLPNTCKSKVFVVYLTSLIITEQFKSSMPWSTNSITNDCSDFPSMKHPLEQLHLNLLSDGGVGVTIHVKVMLDPTGNSKTFLIPLIGAISDSVSR